MRLNLAAALVLTGAAVGACAPNPIIARDPVPAPSPGVRYGCASRPLPLNGFWSECEPVLREQRAAIRAKG